jgi:hypothetical protein
MKNIPFAMWHQASSLHHFLVQVGLKLVLPLGSVHAGLATWHCNLCVLGLGVFMNDHHPFRGQCHLFEDLAPKLLLCKCLLFTSGWRAGWIENIFNNLGACGGLQMSISSLPLLCLLEFAAIRNAAAHSFHGTSNGRCLAFAAWRRLCRLNSLGSLFSPCIKHCWGQIEPC